MNSASVQATIARAIDQEARHRQFRQRLAGLLPELHYHLVLPESDPLATLVEFVLEYVQAVPGALDAAELAGERGGFSEHVAPMTRQARALFLEPQDNAVAAGLEPLLRRCFLVHRLMEEVSDYYHQKAGFIMLPMDLTEANLIVHHLLGEATAGRLERRVSDVAQQHFLRLPAAAFSGLDPGEAEGTRIGPAQSPLARERVRLRVAVPR